MFSQNERGFELAQQNEVEKGETYVIIIGVSEYPNLDESKQLNYADDDAALIENYFLQKENIKKENIHTFINGDANNRFKIIQEIDNLIDEAKSNDLLILYFAGHGDVGDKFNKGYFLLSSVENPNKEKYDYSLGALPFDKIKEYIDSATEKGIITLLLTDACRSGIVVSNEDYKNQTLASLANNWGNSPKIVSCQPNENSQEGTKWGNGHGVFTYYLVNGLKGLADADNDSIVSYKEINRYLEDNVSKETKNRQNPSSSNAPPNMPISRINQDQIIEEDISLTKPLNVDNLNKNRGLNNYFDNLSPITKELLIKYEKCIKNQQFFNEDLTKIKELDYATKKEQSKTFEKNIKNMALSYNMDKIAFSNENSLHVIDTSLNDILKDLSNHKKEITTIAFNINDSLIATGSEDKTVLLWNANNGELIKKVKNPYKATVTSIAFINNQELIVGDIEGNLFSWDTVNKKAIKIESKHIDKINKIVVNNQKTYTISEDGYIKVLDLNHSTLNTVKAHSKVKDIEILPISNKIQSIGWDGYLKNWNPGDLSIIDSTKLPINHPTSIAIDKYEHYSIINGDESFKKNLTLIQKGGKNHFEINLGNNSKRYRIIYDRKNEKTYSVFDDKTIEKHAVKFNYNDLSAQEILELLLQETDIKAKQRRVIGSLIVSVNEYVNSIINPLINGELNKPNLNELEKAVVYNKKLKYLNNLMINSNKGD